MDPVIPTPAGGGPTNGTPAAPASAPASAPSAAAPSAPAAPPVVSSPAAPVPGSAAAPDAAAAPAPADQAPAADPDLGPREGETAQQYHERITAAGVDIKRVKDAQREMHAATTEAAALRTNLETIERHFGPPPKQVDLANDADLRAADQRVTEAYTAYQNAPEAQAAEAFQKYQDERDARAELRFDKKQQARWAEATATNRMNAVLAEHNKAITAHVAKIAPDVKPKTFWNFAREAQALTPPDVQGIARIEWQVSKAIQLARDEIASYTKPASDAAAEAAAHAASARVVMPGGGAVPSASPATPPARSTFVEELEQARARRSA